MLYTYSQFLDSENMNNVMHPILRAKQKYGVDLTVGDLAYLRKLVLKEKTTFDGYTTKGRKEIHLVTFKSKLMKFIYCRKINRVMTFVELAYIQNVKLYNRSLNKGVW